MISTWQSSIGVTKLSLPVELKVPRIEMNKLNSRKLAGLKKVFIRAYSNFSQTDMMKQETQLQHALAQVQTPLLHTEMHALLLSMLIKQL